MGPCKICTEKSNQLRDLLKPFGLDVVEPVGGVRILGEWLTTAREAIEVDNANLADARAAVAALTAERDALRAELAGTKEDLRLSRQMG